MAIHVEAQNHWLVVNLVMESENLVHYPPPAERRGISECLLAFPRDDEGQRCAFRAQYCCRFSGKLQRRDRHVCAVLTGGGLSCEQTSAFPRNRKRTI